MKQYLELCRHILENGVEKKDRTGTGTKSVFGYQMRFDLAKGFPLLTTKDMGGYRLNGIIHELLWFLSGDTNIKYLVDNNVNIWNKDSFRYYKANGGTLTKAEFIKAINSDESFAKQHGDLGRIYGHQWTSWGADFESITQPIPRLRECLKPTYLGVANGADKEQHPLKKTWEGMIARCYDKNSNSYRLYGAKGVHVCNEWLEFSKFAEDATNLPGWDNKVASDTRYVLDKDTKGDGFTYSKDTCCWVTDLDNGYAKSTRLFTVEKDGVEYQFTNPAKFCAEQGISNKNFSDLWTGNKNAKVRCGFRLVKVEDMRNKGINQISEVIDEIKTNPDSRRLIVNAWNVGEIHEMALPPCHVLFQFYVSDGKLSCQLYQRSGDVFLGVPYNIASYALLTMMIADQCGLGYGEFIHTLGDAHIYLNHIEQVKLQLTREPHKLPNLVITSPELVGSIFDYKRSHFGLYDYFHYPEIKGEVSVGEGL